MMQDSSTLLIYKASAGSGKTRALAKEFLKILINNPYDYNRILAVTFTKKATEEMKTRIIEYLSLLEKDDASVADLKQEIINDINEIYKKDVSNTIVKNANIALQLILHDYSHFNISTIDSFFQSIIRSYAKELDLPIGLEVELDTQRVLEHAVQAMLKEYVSEKDAFSKWIEEYLFDLIEDDKSWKIEKNIVKLSKELFKEDYRLLATENPKPFNIEAYKTTLNELRKITKQYKQSLTTLTEKLEQKLQQEQIDLSLFFQGNKSVQSFINSTKLYTPSPNSYLLKMLNGEPLFSKTTAKDEQLAAQLTTAWNAYIQPYISEVLNIKEQQEKVFFSAEIVLKNIYTLALMEYINQKIIEYKAEKNLILISDTNQIISVIAAHEEVSFIFEKSATYLKYILIDEFQDTSALQWQGMLPLLLELLQGERNIVMIVGDPKQSIYRWRGGKMELMTTDIHSDFVNFNEYKKEVVLDSNYRSAKEIITFNNAFFTTIQSTISLENKLFDAVLADVQQKNSKETVGFVQCKWLEKSKEEDVHLVETLQIIQSLSATKKYGEITILTRNNKHGAAVANYLKEQQIPVVSAESLLLYTQLPIRLLVAALEYVIYSEENFYVVKLNYLLALFNQQENPEKYLSTTSNEYYFENKIPELNRANTSKLKAIAINELTAVLIQYLKLDVVLDDYILRFQDIVYKYVQQHSNSIFDFLEYWQEQKERISIIPPDGIDAVKIYTIHKSKGLQFPIVIMPYANWSMKPKPDSTIWIHNETPPFKNLDFFPVEMTQKMESSLFEEEYKEELELNYIDNINLLYVAFTRAEEQLYIISNKEKESKNNDIPQNVSKLLKSVLLNMNLENAILEEDLFQYGNANTITEKSKKITQIEFLQKPAYKNFKDTLALTSNKHYNEAQEKGTILHEILAKINSTTSITKAIASTTIDADGYYLQATQRVLQFMEQQQWTNDKWQFLQERAIWYNGELSRPDKVLLNDEQCIIIDYKTGNKEKAHTAQLQYYKEAYANLFTQKISAYLLYTDSLTLIEI